jgi:Tol biopolymer transport system component
MGVVYLAEDTRLGRSVAVKVLPSAADPAALGRFVREARTVAALQHPHIAVLHDVGEEDGTSYLVMERIEGESLAAALAARGPLPWKDVLRLGEELASALIHAHGLGVLHRDIKPGNIMLCPGRGAVLLDFGLAQRVHLRQKIAENQPTETMDRLTRAGAVVGTMSYLSPEQLEERALDARSDLFQLGLTLYEAAGGVHPFHGPTGVDVMHAILRLAPAPLHEVAAVPEELSRIVGRLLEKDPEYRHPDARALEADLRHLARTSAGTSAPIAVPARRSRSRRGRAAMAWTTGVAIGVAGFAVGRWWTGPSASPAAPARVVPLTHGQGNDASPAFSPDGKSLVFASDRDGNWDLWVALVAGGAPVAITRTPEKEGLPAWSPDGSQVAFQRARPGGTRSDVYLMPALGGDARKLVEDASDPAWSPDGRVLAYADFASGWSRIATIPVAPGGQPTAVTSVEEGFFHRRPSWTPDGRAIVFNRSPGGRVGVLMRVPAIGGTPETLTRDPEGTANIAAAVTPDGRHVVHASDRGGSLNLWRIPIAGGPPERITAGAGQDLEPQVSRDGRRIVFIHSPVVTRLLAWSPATGRSATLTSLLGSEAWAPRVSPDGAQVVFSQKVAGNPWKMVLLERASGATRTLLEGLPDVLWARFHPDGRSLVFDARFRPGGRIGQVGLDGRGLRWLTAEGGDATYCDVSPDGRQIAFVRSQVGGADVVVRSISGGPERLAAPGATLPAFSPDGRRLLIARSRSFSGGVGVVDVAGGEPRWLTTSGTWPVWSADGRSILFADVGPEGDQAAWTVALDGGAPRPLGRYRWRGAHYPFALANGELITTDSSDTKSTLWLAEY